jgi:Restriction endonuclease BglII
VGVVALEIEWNNKDPFFDRDLENFKRLHAEGAISVGTGDVPLAVEPCRMTAPHNHS